MRTDRLARRSLAVRRSSDPDQRRVRPPLGSPHTRHLPVLKTLIVPRRQDGHPDRPSAPPRLMPGVRESIAGTGSGRACLFWHAVASTQRWGRVFRQ